METGRGEECSVPYVWHKWEEAQGQKREEAQHVRMGQRVSGRDRFQESKEGREQKARTTTHAQPDSHTQT